MKTFVQQKFQPGAKCLEVSVLTGAEQPASRVGRRAACAAQTGDAAREVAPTVRGRQLQRGDSGVAPSGPGAATRRCVIGH